MVRALTLEEPVNHRLSAIPLLFQDRIVAVIHQPCSHTLGLFNVGKRPDLHMKKFVGSSVGDESLILAAFERLHKGLSVLLLAHCRDLDEVAGNRLQRRQGRGLVRC